MQGYSSECEKGTVQLRYIRQNHWNVFISSHLSALTLEVVGAPQMTLQQYLSILPCLPFLLAHFTVPCRIVFAMPEDLEMWPYFLSFSFFTMVRRSSCTPIAFWILLRTSSFVTWSLELIFDFYLLSLQLVLCSVAAVKRLPVHQP